MTKCYRWDESFMAEKVEKLINKYNKSLRGYRREEIEDIIDMYREMNDIIKNKSIDEKKDHSLDEFYTKMTDYKKNYPFCFSNKMNNFIERISNLNEYNDEPEQSLVLPEEDMINHVNNFYKDNNGYHVLEFILKNRNPYLFHFTYNDLWPAGMAYLDSYNSTPYIAIFRQNNIEDLFTVAHEAGHAIETEIAHGFCYSSSIPAKEFIAFLMELLLADYNHRINYEINSTNNLCLSSYNEMIALANIAKMQKSLFDLKMNKSNPEHNNLDTVINNIPEQDLKAILSAEGDYLTLVNLIYSFVYANDVFYQYRENVGKSKVDIIDMLLKSRIVKIRPNELVIDDNLEKLSNTFEEKYKVNVLK